MAGKKGQFSTGIFRHHKKIVFTQSDVCNCKLKYSSKNSSGINSSSRWSQYGKGNMLVLFDGKTTGQLNQIDSIR